MESEVVLLIDLDNLSNDYDLTLNYIGGSRAFLVLSAFVSEKAENQYQNLAKTFGELLAKDTQI